MSTNKHNQINTKAEGLRLIYVDMAHKADKNSDGKAEIIYGISSPFRLPKGMNIKEACFVVAYLTNMVQEEYGLERASYSNVAKVSSLLEEYGFTRLKGYQIGYSHILKDHPTPNSKVDTSDCEEIDGVADLFTINGNIKMFKNSDLYKRFFGWYTTKTDPETLKKLYKKINSIALPCEME